MTGSIARPLALALLLLQSACAAARTRTPAEESGGRRAALARLTVENRTDRTLIIAFRAATPPGGEVAVGDVAPNTTEAMAPIPADEPIILLARSADGTEMRLPPRSFGLDATFHWVIPADARFAPPGGGSP